MAAQCARPSKASKGQDAGPFPNPSPLSTPAQTVSENKGASSSTHTPCSPTPLFLRTKGTVSTTGYNKEMNFEDHATTTMAYLGGEQCSSYPRAWPTGLLPTGEGCVVFAGARSPDFLGALRLRWEYDPMSRPLDSSPAEVRLSCDRCTDLRKRGSLGAGLQRSAAGH